MGHKSLQEVSKFLAGLVAGDLITLVWLSQAHLLPVHLLGATFDQSMILPGVIFDFAMFIVLVHYGWHIGKIPQMRERTYMLTSAVLFTVVAVAHLWRLFASGALVIMGWSVPLWLSWIGVAITAYLAYESYRFASRVQRK
jgi:hypothetical protein